MIILSLSLSLSLSENLKLLPFFQRQQSPKAIIMSSLSHHLTFSVAIIAPTTLPSPPPPPSSSQTTHHHYLRQQRGKNKKKEKERWACVGWRSRRWSRSRRREGKPPYTFHFRGFPFGFWVKGLSPFQRFENHFFWGIKHLGPIICYFSAFCLHGFFFLSFSLYINIIDLSSYIRVFDGFVFWVCFWVIKDEMAKKKKPL